MVYSYNRYLRAMGWGGRTEATFRTIMILINIKRYIDIHEITEHECRIMELRTVFLQMVGNNGLLILEPLRVLIWVVVNEEYTL